jgi:hypothetical protein
MLDVLFQLFKDFVILARARYGSLVLELFDSLMFKLIQHLLFLDINHWELRVLAQALLVIC